jgi:hypothetical protein
LTSAGRTKPAENVWRAGVVGGGGNGVRRRRGRGG